MSPGGGKRAHDPLPGIEGPRAVLDFGDDQDADWSPRRGCLAGLLIALGGFFERHPFHFASLAVALGDPFGLPRSNFGREPSTCPG
jgi:hypothetical protein